jgi:hypothetical protein
VVAAGRSALEIWGARLEASADRVAELEEAIRAERGRRDDLMEEGFDLAVAWKEIARRARCSVTLVRKVVAG